VQEVVNYLKALPSEESCLVSELFPNQAEVVSFALPRELRVEGAKLLV
jgi:hypothetical protein